MLKLINMCKIKSENANVKQVTTHQVESGDTLWKLSEKYNVDFEDLLTANPSITNPNLIYVGQHIKIPTSMSQNKNDKHINIPKCKTYKVKSGDNLWDLSIKLDIVYERLLQVNPQISNPNFIYVGQTINIP